MWQYYVLLMFPSEKIDKHIEVGFFKNPTLFVCSILFSVWEFIDKRFSTYLSNRVHILPQKTENAAIIEDIRWFRRSVSRVLSSPSAMDGHSSGASVTARLVATYPDSGAETRLRICTRMPSLFGFAPGGVYLAVDVAANAVRSYRTLSPLPHREIRRFAFCGTFPRVAPARRYLAPCLRGARTFLPRCKQQGQPSGHLVVRM